MDNRVCAVKVTRYEYEDHETSVLGVVGDERRAKELTDKFNARVHDLGMDQEYASPEFFYEHVCGCTECCQVQEDIPDHVFEEYFPVAYNDEITQRRKEIVRQRELAKAFIAKGWRVEGFDRHGVQVNQPHVAMTFKLYQGNEVTEATEENILEKLGVSAEELNSKQYYRCFTDELLLLSASGNK